MPSEMQQENCKIIAKRGSECFQHSTLITLLWSLAYVCVAVVAALAQQMGTFIVFSHLVSTVNAANAFTTL